MKKSPVLSLCFLLGISLQAQNIEESAYTEKNKTMEAFSFSAPVCNKDVLVNSWKTFIKKQGGKVKGGLINKANGSDIRLSPSGESWNGYFAYSFNDDQTMTIFTSFQDLEGRFINSQSSEKEIAIPVLEKFRGDILKSCALDDLNKAKSYSIALSKEKIRNSDKIMYLEKSLRNDQLKVELEAGKDLSEKEQLNLTKIKQRITANEAELQALKSRNDILEEELKAQNLVILRFQNRMDELEGKIIPGENDTESVPDEKDSSAEENTILTIEEESIHDAEKAAEEKKEQNMESLNFFDR
jgi:hypothetical protein